MTILYRRTENMSARPWRRREELGFRHCGAGIAMAPAQCKERLQVFQGRHTLQCRFLQICRIGSQELPCFFLHDESHHSFHFVSRDDLLRLVTAIELHRHFRNVHHEPGKRNSINEKSDLGGTLLRGSTLFIIYNMDSGLRSA